MSDALTGYRNIPSERAYRGDVHDRYDEQQREMFEPTVDQFYEQLRQARASRDRCIAEARAWSRQVVAAKRRLRAMGEAI